MSAIRLLCPTLIGVMLSASLAGCGLNSSSSVAPDQVVNNLGFEELAALYRGRMKQKLSPPMSVKDFAPSKKGLPTSLKALSKGTIVAVWGAGMSTDSGSDKCVLAYEKQTPQQGGVVLMQDGTVKKMTAEEFAAAPKAKPSQ